MSVLFTGSAGEEINCGSPTILDNIWSGGATITAWVNLLGGGGGGFGRIAAKNSAAAPTNGWAIQFQTIGTHVLFDIDFSIIVGRWNAGTLSLNNYYHIGLTYDSDDTNNNPSFYIDGVFQTETESSTPVGTANTDAAQDFYIGNNVGGARALDGYIEDVRVYNRILSAGEISTIFACKGHDEIIIGLIGRWPLREGAPGVMVTAVEDLTVNANQGTPAGSVVYDESRLSFKRAL